MKGAFTKWLGAALLVIAGIWLAMTALMAFDMTGENPLSKVFGGLFLTAIFAIPGGALYLSGRRRVRAAQFEDTLLGYVRSFDKFTTAEMAQRTGKLEIEVESVIARLVNRDDIDLVFHRPDRTWFHRARLADDDEIIDRCASCGARFEAQLVLADESVRCIYCNEVLT